MNTKYTIKYEDLLLEDKPVVMVPSREYIIEEEIKKVRDLPEDEKPREKLMAVGPASLSVAELLAIVLGTGTKKEEVMTMASRVVKEYGELILSKQTNASQIAKDLDIPEIKAAQIVACSELGRRFFEKNPMTSAVIRSGKDVYEYLLDMRSLSKEHLRGIYLNNHYKVIHDEVISIGTVNSSIIHPREVFKPGIEYGAAAVILAHNHPSGVVEASAADVEVTKQLVAAGKLIGIHLIDHVIIGPDSFVSVAVDYN